MSDRLQASASRVVLTLLHPQHPTPLRQWQFSRESRICVGRAIDNQVVLNDRRVSRHHLELLRLEDAQSDSAVWQVTNHSTNGTFLAGDRVLQRSLPSDCLLELARGGPRLRFQILADSTPEPVIQLPKLNQERSISQSQPCAHLGNAPDNLFCIHCGQPVRVEKVVRHYQVLQVLGKGGMGTTYLAWNPQAIALANSDPTSKGMLQVIKEMNAEMAKVSKAQELFDREAGILKALSHPGIPRFHDFFVEAGKKYLVMELMHGQDLERWVQQQGSDSASPGD